MGYGKGKGKAAPAAEAGHRTKVIPGRVTGTLTEWKGKMGWIVPNEEIDHPEASMHKWRIYCGQEDVESEISGPGATVSFFVYADGTGLGAMHVKEATGKGVQKQVHKAGQGAGQWAQASANKGASKWASAGQGAAKGAGKKKEQREPKEQPAPDKSAREVLNGMPLAGVVVKRHGKVAFIKPDEPVEHELSGKHKGMIYLHMEDLEDSEEPLVGAQVIFFVYVDEHGLGAERCTLVQQGTGTVEGEEAEDDTAKKPVKKSHLKEKGESKNASKTKPKGKGKGKGEWKEKGPSGPELPRERITTEPVMGEMVAWKRKFGWIQPTEPIDHPEAEKHEGKIYVHQKDIEGEPELKEGVQFMFHVFVDSQGLGAEECSAL